MKSILLHVNGDTCLEARLQVAFDLARAYDGHVTCLQPVNFEVFAPGDFYGSAMAAAIPRIKEAAEELRARIEGRLAHEDVSWEWEFCSGQAELKLLERAALHDIILIGPHDVGQDGTRTPSSLAGTLALRAPIPVLVVPKDTKSLDIHAPILVAWNGSAEACVALRQALPLLVKADAVYLASVEEALKRKRHDVPSLDGARYLSRYGIEAELVEIPKGQAKVSDTLFSAAAMRECGMVVMGAYGHSRLAEMLLGGVTRRSLTDPQLPIFLAH
ncbi:MAG: universal stress protein [Pseudomonadota bacterium]